MPTTSSPSAQKRSLTSFSLLSFDCYGTLVDWETGIYTALSPLLQTLSTHTPTHPFLAPTAWRSLVQAFSEQEEPLCLSQPTLPYPSLLALAYKNLHQSLSLPAPSESAATAFGASVPSWPVFPDTVAALQKLRSLAGYKLVILSNVDEASFAGTNAGPLAGFEFDAVYTAEAIGSYKPSKKNFEFLLGKVREEFGVGKEGDLHVGNGIGSDCVPAGEIGMESVWISRRDKDGGKGEGEVGFGWEFETMGDMAEAVEREVKEGRRSQGES